MIRYALVCEHDHGFEAWFGRAPEVDAALRDFVLAG